MKKFLLVLSLSAFLAAVPGCSSLKKLGSIPSELEMIQALRDALTQGLFRSLDNFITPEKGNPLLRFVFPGEAVKIERTLRDLGLNTLINQVTGKFNRAMASAVQVTKPVFFAAVRNMRFRDVMRIVVTDNPHAATDYFKQEMKPDLLIALRPVVDSTIHTEGADREWNNITRVYNSIPLISKPLENNLTDFISARVIDGIFLIVAGEEAQIREKYEFRKTDMMRKVFTWAEQEIKRKATR